MRLCRYSLISILAAICIQLGSGLSHLQLDSNGYYQDLLFALEIPEEDHQPVQHYFEVLETLKIGVRQASKILSELTEPVGRRLRFGNVSVLVPFHLGRQMADSDLTKLRFATWQRKDGADFVLSSAQQEGLEGPVWNLNISEKCGAPASLVKLSTQSLMSTKRENHVGRLLALYFSMFRWGLRRETPLQSPTEKHTLRNNKSVISIASCSAALQTSLKTLDGGRPCNYNESDCRIVVDEPDSSRVASFLFEPFHPGVTRFCESKHRASDPKHVHNPDAANEFNQECLGLSAADVMRAHKDFQENGVWADAVDGTDRKFNFQLVVGPERQRVVIVMETSGSMNSDGRLRSMIAAVSHYLLFTLESGSECALVTFNDKPKVLHGFVLVKSAADRERLHKYVSRLTADGGICIGAAVKLAINLLLKVPNYRSSSNQIFLISDSQDGCSGELDSAISMLQDTNIQVNTIRFGDEADVRMTRLSELTGGRQLFSPVKAEAAALSLITELISTGSDQEGSKGNLLLHSVQAPLEFRPLQFNVSATSNLVFWLFTSKPTEVAGLPLMIRSPSGKTFNCQANSSAICQIDGSVGTLSVRIPDAEIESGIWTVVNLAVRGQRRTRRQTSSFVQIGISGGASQNCRFENIIFRRVNPNVVQMIKENTHISVFVLLNPPHIKYSVYAVVNSASGLAAKFDMIESRKNRGYYYGSVPIHKVLKARTYSVEVIFTAPCQFKIYIDTLTVSEDNPNFDRRRIVPKSVNDISIEENFANKIVRISWPPVEDPSGLLPPGMPVPGYSIRFSRTSASCPLQKDFFSCEELVFTNESSVNVYKNYVAAGMPSAWLSVVAISAANVSTKPSSFKKLENPTPPTREDLIRLGFAVPNVTKNPSQNLLSSSTTRHVTPTTMQGISPTAKVSTPTSNPTTVPSSASNPITVPSSARNPITVPSSASNPITVPSSASNPIAVPSSPSTTVLVPSSASNPIAANSSAKLNLSLINPTTVCFLTLLTLLMSSIDGFD